MLTRGGSNLSPSFCTSAIDARSIVRIPFAALARQGRAAFFIFNLPLLHRYAKLLNVADVASPVANCPRADLNLIERAQQHQPA